MTTEEKIEALDTVSARDFATEILGRIVDLETKVVELEKLRDKAISMGLISPDA